VQRLTNTLFLSHKLSELFFVVNALFGHHVGANCVDHLLVRDGFKK
jgi:hypothetical protein